MSLEVVAQGLARHFRGVVRITLDFTCAIPAYSNTLRSVFLRRLCCFSVNSVAQCSDVFCTNA